MKVRTKSTGIFVWTSVVLFYLYQYILRVSPSVMRDDIMSAFQIDAGGFGALSSVALYSYALLQIPAGILSDLFGTRRMVLLSLLLCVLGVLIFALTDHYSIAYGARILIGSGSACAFLCVSKVSSDWFPPHQKSLFFSLTVIMGTVGALLGGAPFAFLSSLYGWRYGLVILGGIGILIFLINLVMLWEVPAHPDARHHRHSIGKEIIEVLKSRVCWMYAIVALGIYMSIAVFADLWGVSFLMMKYNLSKEWAAEAVSMIYVGTCLGVITIALITRILQDRRLIITLCAFLVPALLAVVIFSNNLSYLSVAIILFFVGFFAGGEILCFINACDQMNTSVAGTVTGFLNCMVTLTGAVLQERVGSALDLLWDGAIDPVTGLPLYTAANYKGALAIVVAICSISFIFSFFLKDHKKTISVVV